MRSSTTKPSNQTSARLHSPHSNSGCPSSTEPNKNSTARILDSLLQSSIYGFNARRVNSSKAFALICCVFSLFVQVAAHAAAVPQSDPINMDCEEMAHGMPQYQMSDQDKSFGQQRCCAEMKLDCLVSMNCLPPLALSGAQPEGAAPLAFAPSYLVIAAASLEGEHARPESPPPQFILTA